MSALGHRRPALNRSRFYTTSSTVVHAACEHMQLGTPYRFIAGTGDGEVEFSGIVQKVERVTAVRFEITIAR